MFETAFRKATELAGKDKNRENLAKIKYIHNLEVYKKCVELIDGEVIPRAPKRMKAKL